MKVIIRHETESGTQIETYQNVAYATTEYQKYNGKGGSYWLWLHFISGSNEYKEHERQQGVLPVGIDLKEDIVEVIE